MSRYLQSKCIDINSDYCPCILASSNHCVFCAHLQGKDVCDCNWSGVCILYEKKWNARNDDVMIAKEHRPEMECAILERELLNENVCRIVLAVPMEMAEQLKTPGSYVFIRRGIDPHYFQIPIGVMQVTDEGNIVVVVEALGPKSIRVVEEDQTLIIRGPYKNGIFGLPWVEKLAYGKVLLLAGGMGQPPALPVAEKLVKNYNRVTAIIAPGAVGCFAAREFQSMDIEFSEVDSLRRTGYASLARKLAEDTWDLVVSCGPDVQHFAVMDTIRKAGYDLPMAATNNNIMCCGEGICGSCAKETVDHQSVRTCKTQLDFADLKR